MTPQHDVTRAMVADAYDHNNMPLRERLVEQRIRYQAKLAEVERYQAKLAEVEDALAYLDGHPQIAEAVEMFNRLNILR